MKIAAAVVREDGARFTIEDLTLADPQPDEIRVRILSAGLCHTDVEAALGHMPPGAPVVLGHEGAGIVEWIGAEIDTVAIGDHVVLSYPHCRVCESCRAGEPLRCPQLMELAFSGARPDGSATLADTHGHRVKGSFFGQSSFSSHVLVRAGNVIPIRKDVPIELMGPLGCGIQTGAGAVINVLRPEAGSAIAIFGAGAVGMAAIMAARLMGCSEIIAIDRVASRLELALDLGATRVVDVTGLDAAAIASAVGEVATSVETSGNPAAIETSLQVLAPFGHCGLVGVAPPGTRTAFDHAHLMRGCRISAVLQGNADPETFIPYLVELYVAGDLPLDRIVKYFDLAEINDAVAASLSGQVIKPVLRMPAASSQDF